MVIHSFENLTDDNLLAEATRLAAAERQATVRLIAALAEIDTRRLYLGQGCSSLFVFCTRVLRLSEHAAYGRIEAARAARRFPVLLDRLERGELTLTTVGLLAPHLTDSNVDAVVERARLRSKRGVEEIVATLRPRPDSKQMLRKLPEKPADVSSRSPLPAGSLGSGDTPTNTAEHQPVPTPAHRAVVTPLAPARYKLQVTISRETEEKLRRARDLMRHSNPSGDHAAILDRALDLLLADLERTKLAVAACPRSHSSNHSGSRHVPAAVRRLVWRRDGGRCAFVGAAGRCDETAFLEFHHVRPFAEGGMATVENIELRCRAHNQYEATLVFGEPPVAREERVEYRTRSGPSSRELSAEDFAHLLERARHREAPFAVPASALTAATHCSAAAVLTSPFGSKPCVSRIR